MTPYLAFVIAFFLSYFATPLATWFAKRYGFTDRPHPRRQPLLKPRLGGVAIYLAFAVAIAVVYPMMPDRTQVETLKMAGIAVGGLVVVVVGAIDDKFELPPLAQFAAQVVAAIVVAAAGVVIDQVTNPFAGTVEDSLVNFPAWFAMTFTVFWIVGAMNTINFLDGVDGLATGVVAVAALVLAVHSFLLGQYTIMVLPLAVAGACLGFLPFNFYPSKATLGSCGSLFLGFAVAAMSVAGGTKAATLLLVLGLPVVDTGWTIVRRILSGQSPFAGDRSHLHHRLLSLGLSETRIVLGMYGASLVLGMLSLALSTRMAKLYAIGLMTLATLVLVAALAYLTQRKRQSPPRPESG